MAAVFNLNHHAPYVHWHFFEMSVSNLVVIALMVVVFVAAILLPFPTHRATGGSS
jgi:membrane protein YqaA with SNARE-associated domain